MPAASVIDFVLLAAIWGSSFLFMRFAVVDFGVLPSAAVRVGIAAAFLLPLAWMVWVKLGGAGTQATSDLRLPLVWFYAVSAAGVTAALRQNSWVDYSVMALAMIGMVLTVLTIALGAVALA